MNQKPIICNVEENFYCFLVLSKLLVPTVAEFYVSMVGPKIRNMANELTFHFSSPNIDGGLTTADYSTAGYG